MADYRNFSLKLANGGLDLVSPPDLQAEGRYTQLTNVRSRQEGLLTTRAGSAVLLNYADSEPPIVIRRLDAGGLLVQKGGTLYRNLVQIDTGFGSAPVTSARFKSPNTGQGWTYIGSATKLVKIRNSDGTVFKWGVEAPSVALVSADGGAGVLDSSVAGYIPYDWRYTYFSSLTGAESNPSPIQAGTLALTSRQATITGFVTSTDPQVDNYRIYRRGGPIVNTWKRVDTIPDSTVTYTDNLSDTSLSLFPDISEDNAVPFNTVDVNGTELKGTPLAFVWGPYRGKYIFACGDPNRPGYLYWTNTESPDGASPFNNISVTDPAAPLINGFIYGTDSFIWTRDNLYALDFGGPDAIPTFVPRQVPIGMGLSAPYAFAVAAGGVFFLSKDGIYATDCTNQSESLTKDSIRPIFMGKTVGNFAAVDYTQQNSLRLEYVGQELHFLYKDVNGASQHIFYDILHKRWQKYERTPARTAVYGDENQSQFTLLMGLADGDIYQANIGDTDSNTAITATVETGAWDSDIPLTLKEYGNAILDADPLGSTITITPIYNAGAVVGTPVSVTGFGRQPFPFTLSDTYQRNVAFRLTWNGQAEVYQVVLLFREDEEPVSHWEHPETAFGAQGAAGWFHVRDAYFCLRSTAAVTLTQTVDGVAYTYTLASTAGERRKVYVKLRPVKGKVFRWSLDSSAVFRLYGEDTHLNVKPWNTAKAYEPSFPFQGVGYAPYLRKGGGT